MVDRYYWTYDGPEVDDDKPWVAGLTPDFYVKHEDYLLLEARFTAALEALRQIKAEASDPQDPPWYIARDALEADAEAAK